MAATIASPCAPGTSSRRQGREAKLAARAELRAPALAELARLDDAAFRALFAKSPVKRIGRDRFVRNVLIAIGNSGDAALAREAERLLDDESPLVRGAAVWALSQLMGERRSRRWQRRWRETMKRARGVAACKHRRQPRDERRIRVSKDAGNIGHVETAHGSPPSRCGTLISSLRFRHGRRP